MAKLLAEVRIAPLPKEVPFPQDQTTDQTMHVGSGLASRRFPSDAPLGSDKFAATVTKGRQEGAIARRRKLQPLRNAGDPKQSVRSPGAGRTRPYRLGAMSSA